ncbi:unnamed protein product [marine sediment metagenome]|uniref:Uncharacterized protein n=1 Tax=marine sediment metagenome TaxID=412755 RepID=X0XNH8_9ZZZZ
MASGAAKVAYGSFLGTGAALTVKTPGFRPRYVRIVNGTGPNAEWFESMADDTAVKHAQTGATTLLTSDGITPLADGFGVGADADLNAAGEVVHFMATE